MNDIEKPVRRADPGRWGLAAVLGLLSVIFLWDYASRADKGASAPRQKSGRDTPLVDLVTEDENRGRQAERPSEIPAKGWKDILLRICSNIGKHRILALAAGTTYYSILAIFPALGALVAVYGLFSDPGSIAKLLDRMSGFVPGGAIDVAREQLTRLAATGSQTLGITFAIGLVVSLWSANAAMKSLVDTLNVVYGEEEKRGFFRLNALTLGFTLAGILFVLMAAGSVVVVPVVLNFLHLSHPVDMIVRLVRWPIMFAVLALALAFIYRFGPSRQAPRWRWITWGSALAALFWVAASAVFSWYAANFGTFNETYGSLGAVIGFMTWLWLSAIVVLLGAEFDAEMEHQTMLDTTAGRAKPLGARGARMADTVGAASDRT